MTAARQGIGRAAALAFAAEGRACWRPISRRRSSRRSPPRSSRRGGSTSPPAIAIAALAADLSPLDILFNCAGFVHHGSILDAEPINWDASFALNARSMFMMIRVFLPMIIARGSGASIINMAYNRILHQTRPELLRPCRDECGGDRADESGGRRFHRGGHPL